MTNDTIENITENLFYVLPIIHKKLLKVDPPEIKPRVNLSRIHVAVIGIVRDEGPLPISEIARMLLMPKPQMTHVVNYLAKSGIVEKRPSPRDKRVVNVVLSSEGEITAGHLEEFLKNNIRKNLSYLSEKELEELSSVLVKLRELGTRIVNEGKNAGESSQKCSKR